MILVTYNQTNYKQLDFISKVTTVGINNKTQCYFHNLNYLSSVLILFKNYNEFIDQYIMINYYQSYSRLFHVHNILCVFYIKLNINRRNIYIIFTIN